MEWLLLLLCPLMMIFMMKGFHTDSHEGQVNKKTEKEMENLKIQNQEISEELDELRSKMNN